ncbi:hypothetical protein DMA11_06615 [Marinilabiliaceae bacterium JC017]|nr:hypothetical protein DMA11_06615 [Marinilabiliaceae bacterium JC017]
MKFKNFALAISVFCGAVLVSCSNDEDDNRLSMTLKTTDVTSNSAIVAWEPVKGAIYYEVSITHEGEALDDPEMIEDKTSYEFDELLAGKEYEVKVLAGKSFASEKIIAEGKVQLTTKTLPEEFVGTWAKSDDKYIFKADGTGNFRYSIPVENCAEAWGFRKTTWTVNEGKLTIRIYATSVTSTSETFSYSFNEDNTVLTLNETEQYKKEE